MIKILLIRHALTDFVGKRLSGRSPGIFLNEEGRKQSYRLAERLESHSIDAIYCSPLERAIETAEPLSARLNSPYIVSDDFIEIDYGRWTNCSIEEMKEDPLFVRYNLFRSGQRIPGGEQMHEAQARIIKGIEKLHNSHKDQTVAVITHSDLIKSAIAWYAGIHLDLFHRLEISPASVSIIQIYDHGAQILLMNDTGEVKT